MIILVFQIAWTKHNQCVASFLSVFKNLLYVAVCTLLNVCLCSILNKWINDHHHLNHIFHSHCYCVFDNILDPNFVKCEVIVISIYKNSRITPDPIDIRK